ncbi:sortase domain-containing protein [Arthrobacter sp. 9AX]|uniref:sortase domain-containing protein n=1 Tax=Arthrobacter sp. 9AX TaxID=2653131 RepID=UPI001F24DD90|nr:hypothetical protein [Arthrobacter sp. 9AX]
MARFTNSGHRWGLGASTAAGLLFLLALGGCAAGPATSDAGSAPPGSSVSVLRADGSTAVFSVERGARYSKDSFPTLEVYGNTAGSELRLVTCDGYDASTGLFADNYVIYAKPKT